MLLKELAAVLEIPRPEQRTLERLLRDLLREGEIVQTQHRRYGLPSRMNLVTGRIQGHPEGYGFLIPDEPGEADIYIPARKMREAMHRDRVIVRVEGENRGRREGALVRVLERAYRQVVGRYETGRRFGFVRPTDRRLWHEIAIPMGDDAGARPGQLVVAEITGYPSATRQPEGRVARILGDALDPRLDTEMVVEEFGLPREFPPAALAKAEALPDKITDKMSSGRRDLRHVPFVTIDGERARDHDDAVAIEPLVEPKASNKGGEREGFRLWVAIADVGAYVPWETPLDLEARRRGNSVYFPDLVLPMFPERLSNNLCSLRPNEDRLALIAEITFDAQGARTGYRLYEGVIRSRERMTYTAVQDVLEGKPEAVKRYRDLAPHFRRMEHLCRLLYAKRMARGSLDFDLPEAEIVVDLAGETTEILRELRKISHRIVEEFMLAANETVAEHLHQLGIPIPYRIHEDPDPDKIVEFNEFLRAFGLSIPGVPTVRPKALQGLLETVRGRPEERLINHLLLRSMRQARYSHEPAGHFGLAAWRYTHFTSPIRRYADLIIHRALKDSLHGPFPADRKEWLRHSLPSICRQISDTERVASDAEREVADLKQARFMADKIGEEYDGFITGVTAYGLYIELADIFVEGLVHVRSMHDDYYRYIERQHALIGERTHKAYRLGDRVRVRVESVDMVRRQVDFSLADLEPPRPKRKGKTRGRRGR